MKNIVTLLFLLLCFVSGISDVAASSNAASILIPVPNSIEELEGEFQLQDGAAIIYEDGAMAQAEYLKEVLERSTGFTLNLKVKRGGKLERGAIVLLFDESLKEDGYVLEVGDKNIVVRGADTGGVFYAIQSMLQLFPSEVYGRELHRGVEWKISAVRVEDAPSYYWRGMMLDVARYFYDKEFVMKYIDMMAMYKLNKMQFHFIDDSGWRLEIKKYPLLTEIGAWSGTDGSRLGGYYTQDDIREIVAYAAVRNVEVIPEIEFPAHMLSAIAAYPWLSCTEEQHEVPSQHFISRDLLCLGKESSYQFLEDVLKETVELFPSKYINIGGDEAVYERWEACPHCQRVQREQGLESASQMQGYLTNVVSNMMKKYDRTIVGWEEIVLRGKIDNQVVGVVWHKLDYTKPITDAGHYAILCPASHTYFDFPESVTPGEIKAAKWMPNISLEKCYSLSADSYNESGLVLGVQGCFWSDQFIHGDILREFDILNENRSEAYAEYLTFPRLLALSEISWSRESDRDFGDFSQRVTKHYAKLDKKECGYRIPEPYIVSAESVDEGVRFTLSPSVEGSQIRYTTDGTYPKFSSKLYSEPVVVSDSLSFRASTMVAPRRLSLPIYFSEDYSEYKQFGEFLGSWKEGDSNKWVVDATGKIAADHKTYRVTFISLDGRGEFDAKSAKMFKRDECVAQGVRGTSASFNFLVTEFEAGTPFFVEIEISGKGANVGAFIRKQ
ncbi:MAG: family 20 glycosylhydrolase [Rikenellaceae bacterium]